MNEGIPLKPPTPPGNKNITTVKNTILVGTNCMCYSMFIKPTLPPVAKCLCKHVHTLFFIMCKGADRESESLVLQDHEFRSS